MEAILVFEPNLKNRAIAIKSTFFIHVFSVSNKLSIHSTVKDSSERRDTVVTPNKATKVF